MRQATEAQGPHDDVPQADGAPGADPPAGGSPAGKRPAPGAESGGRPAPARWLRRLGEGWHDRGHLTPEQRRAVLAAVALRPSSAWLFRFGVLQTLAVVIAVMGLTTDSAAVVIGAMLVAPLMSPIMGVSASLAMGWGRRANRSAAIVGAAAIGSILLSFVLSAVVPGAGITDEILARTSPGATDLVIALAAGLAGAYATVRPDISSSLPGVAVAVALVPPLATVGVTWQAGEPDLALGALLLFATNLAAIIFAGLIVFPATGFVPGHLLRSSGRRLAANGVVSALIVVSLATLLTGRTIEAASQAEDVAAARRLAANWLTGTGLDLSDVSFDGARVIVSVTGPQPPPEPTPLARQLSGVLGDGTELEIQWFQRSTVAANGRGLTSIDVLTLEDEVQVWLAGSGTDADLFTVDVGLDDQVVKVAVVGPVAPPPQARLERRLVARFGFAIPLVVEATVAVTDTDQAATGERLAAVTVAWAAERGLTVVDTVFDGTVSAVVVEGPTPPGESGSLSALLARELGRPVETVVRYRSVAVVPPDQPAGFSWPLDCGAVDAPVEGAIGARPGFTATPLGAWLRDRLASGGLGFADDGGSWTRTHADGILHVWAESAAAYPGADRREVAAPAAGSRRGTEVRVRQVGPVVLWAELVPLPVAAVAGTVCVPSTAELDTWFAQVEAAAGDEPFPDPVPAVSDPRPAVAPDPLEAVLTVATAAGLPVGVTDQGSLVVRQGSIDLPLGVEPRPGPPADGSQARRAGGLTLSVPSTDPATGVVLDQLVAELARRPWLGAPA